jgi:hypothetical protein
MDTILFILALALVRNTFEYYETAEELFSDDRVNVIFKESERNKPLLYQERIGCVSQIPAKAENLHKFFKRVFIKVGLPGISPY